MRFVLALFFVFCAIYGIVRLVTHDDGGAVNTSWNSNCQYGNEYIMPDGTVVTHSECK